MTQNIVMKINMINRKCLSFKWLKPAVFISLMTVLFSACLATAPAYKDPPEAKGNNVLVVLFRPDSQGNSGMDSLFYMNGVNVARLSRNQYTWLHVPEGKYILKHVWSGNDSDALQSSLVLQKGSSYFFSLKSSNLNGNIRWLLAANRFEDIATQIRKSDYRAAINTKPPSR